ncbi:helix-turn-helix domain-containing protein [Pseudobdellovibrio exovorus]|uniref:Putative transcriptional regulator n=1 Tax=Pseudobdellovibrio exovorus JSS TaxID=1184267 RepID=M4VSA9_9BACT|nr:helix-turn-helix domain-containing protein [Pseudobdellovibrio exovorus]AGH96079.1 putative transcriptional regulator [Pseudobdellovibrio exovorus JSS]
MAQKTHNKPKSSDIRYPMQAFGNLLGHIEKIRVNQLEHRLTPKVPFPHKHDFYHILIITKGKGSHEVDFTKYPVLPHTIFILKPGQIHSWTLDPNTTGYVVEFELPAIQNSLQQFNVLENILLTLPDHLRYRYDDWKELLTLVESARLELHKQEEGYEALACFKVAELLFLIYRRIPKTIRQRFKQDDYAQQFLRLVEDNFTSHHQIEFYAQKLGVTAKALSMRLSRSLNLPARTIIQNRCLLEAKRLLGYSNKSINQISYALGFEDPNYFSRFFKKATGQTPVSFRQKIKKS